MRLAIIRQRYAPAGGAERFFEGALEALLERNVAISLYTRSWPQTKLQLIEPVICNPWYAGSFLREWGFARSVCRAIARSKANLVESHERLLCCDIYRARDGVHAVWQEERMKGALGARAPRLALSPYNRYMRGMEKRLFASPWLQAVICNSAMVKDEIRDRFGVAGIEAARRLQRGRQRRLPSAAARAACDRAQALRHRRSRYRVPARGLGLRAQRRGRRDRGAGRAAVARRT